MWELFQREKPRMLAAAAEADLSPMQAHALRMLDPEEPRPMSELAGALFCDASNVTGIVDRLEARGLVERLGAEHDRRVKALAVTPEGVQVRGRLFARMQDAPSSIAGLSAADQRALRDILRRALG